MKSFNTLTKALIGLGISAFSVASLAAPTAGTSIGNQAAATYTDASAISRTATSNTVTTIVQQVAAFTLTSSQTKNAGPGAPVSFTHTITNTGNGSDTFALTLTNNAAGDNFDLTTINTFIDADCNGVADNATPVTSVGPIAPGASVCVVVSGSVPATATSGQTGILTLAAASGFTPATTASNLDTVTVTSNAVIGINKAISSPGGNPGSGPYTYTLTYTNTGNANASNVVLADVIPAGMTYTAASGRWSGSVPAGTALTDAAAGDPAGINYDFGVTTSGAITAVITSVPANSSGTLTFQVSINANQAPGYIYNTAKLCYNDGVSQQPAGCTAANTTTTGSSSSTPSFLVAQVAAVNANGSTTDSTSASNTAPIASATQGATVSFNNIIWNRGNGSDTFDITMPSANTPPNMRHCCLPE